jgi:hypothetical protein
LARLPSKKNVASGDDSKSAFASREKIDDPTQEESHDRRLDPLDDLSSLLEAAHGLMKQDRRLDAAAFEYLRRLRVKVRFAKSTASRQRPEQTEPFPEIAPKLFVNRENKNQSPLDFTKEVYGRWLGRWLISRADIRRIDIKLYEAYPNWGVTSEQLDALGLPTKKVLLDHKLREAGPLERPSTARRHGELSEADAERLRLWEVAEQRRRRHTPR